jgi:hypothetical protein
MHLEFGIMVYPSALTDRVAPSGLGTGQTFTEAYSDHIGKVIELIGDNILMIVSDVWQEQNDAAVPLSVSASL